MEASPCADLTMSEGATPRLALPGLFIFLNCIQKAIRKAARNLIFFLRNDASTDSVLNVLWQVWDAG